MAIPIAFGFMFLFVLLQKLGIVNLVSTGNVTYGTAFIVGIIASLSTCMAVVGGLLLSMSATFARGGDKIRPQALFHIGRIISFLFSAERSALLVLRFSLARWGTFALGIIIGLVMLILGINLLDIFHWTKRFQPSMPKFLSQKSLESDKNQSYFHARACRYCHIFLPCGFTQSMQIFTLSTGNFLQGGLTMLTFALGTFPVLALISFSSFSIQNNSKAGIFSRAPVGCDSFRAVQYYQ